MIKRFCIRAYGIVQGIGFRPFVSRTAVKYGIRGDVCNKGSYVEIHAEGGEEALASFRRALTEDAPAVSAIIRVEEKEEKPQGDERFIIKKSRHEAGEIFVSPDLAICPKCSKELLDPSNRRYLHPFINCTDCGPRLTILDSMPYDRVRTSMGEFPMCPECEYEYTHAGSRRFHAQPVCCNDCGPDLYIPGRNEKNGEAIIYVRKVLREGGIAAIKGIGGFHLCCNALDDQAVRRLRRLKDRPMKPFAVMMRDMAAVRRECRILPGEEKILTGVQKPILILKRREEGAETLQHLPDTADALQSLQDKTDALQNLQNMADALQSLQNKTDALQNLQNTADALQSLQNKAETFQNLSGTAGCTKPGKAVTENEARLHPRLSVSVAPDNPTVGVMLPYAPVQLLLFSYPDGGDMTDAFVMTSGNPRGAPICRDDEEALKYLSPMCDVILSNNRKIRLRADDSVMQYIPASIDGEGSCGGALPERGEDIFQGAGSQEYTGNILKGSRPASEGKPYMVRRSRGYAPLPFKGKKGSRGSVLAVGGELKNTFCLTKDELSYPSPYIGDLADLRSVRALGEAVTRMETLLEIKPEAVACDLHPRYNSTAFAESLGLPVVYVQHHYAHILSCMAENEVTEETIGVSFDGTGYGTDGTVWGGEFLQASPAGFKRLGSIAPFRQAGGDLSSKEGWRVAVSLLYDAFGGSGENAKEAVRREAAFLHLCDEKELKAQFLMLDRGINTVTSTSAGRLFDAFSAILGIRRASTFEGEASMALEFAAGRWRKPAEAAAERSAGKLPGNAEAERLPQPVVPPKLRMFKDTEHPLTLTGGLTDTCGDERFILETLPLLRALTEGMHSGIPVSDLAYGFHAALAEMVAAGVRECSRLTGIKTVALSGGVFQNLTLLGLCRKRLEEKGFRCLVHSLVPPNDGGIALGQAVAAQSAVKERDCRNAEQ